jgi:peptide maturation system acyl carrier-related protein
VEDFMKNIENILKSIFIGRLEIDFNKLEADLLDEPLLGKKLGLAPRDLIYILRDIEEAFQIKIPQEDIGIGRFSSFNNIVSIISNQI